MNLIKIVILNLLLVLNTFALAQAPAIVFEEHFDNNDNGWKIPNGPTDHAGLKMSKMAWQHNDVIGNSINNYLNLLNTKVDFSVEARFDIRKIGSEYGLMIGGIDQENALFFTAKNLQYRIFDIRKGKSQVLNDYTPSLKIRPDFNVLKVVRKGAALVFYANDHLLKEIPYPVLMGKSFGFSLWNPSSVEIDDFIVRGTKLKINLAPNLYYNSPPENLGPQINTPYDEITPVVAADGKGLYFTRTYYPENKAGVSDYQDIYYSSFKGGAWSKAVNLGTPVNNDGPNAVSAVSPDANSLLLMNTYDSHGGALGMGLSLSYRTNEGWSIPEKLNVRNYYNKSTFTESFLSSDNKILLLALQREESYGTRDIYVSFLEPGGVWSTPRNLGPVINTPGTELSPFLAPDGVSLYFSSTGHPGYGKNDIFISRRLDDTWTKWSVPQNVGMPVNSKGMDAYYSIPASGEFAYFISQDHSLGKNDIFRIKLPSQVKPNPIVLIHGKVLNSKTKAPIATGITYRDMSNDKEVGIARSSPSDGSYKIALPYNRAYSFFAEKEGFYSVRDTISVPNIKEYMEIERNIYLTPLEIGQDVPLNNVFFVRGEPTLISTSYPELNKLAKILVENPTLEIELSGHTDNVGDAGKNQILSEQRVEMVKKYLVSKGAGEERISGKGYGGSRPIADNSVEATRKLNRRVEFKITKF